MFAETGRAGYKDLNTGRQAVTKSNVAATENYSFGSHPEGQRLLTDVDLAAAVEGVPAC